MKGIRLGNNVIFVSSYKAGNLTHTHKPQSTVGHCPCFSNNFQKSKSKAPGFFYQHIRVSYSAKRGLNYVHRKNIEAAMAKIKQPTPVLFGY
jgi:hypothetical protein